MYQVDAFTHDLFKGNPAAVCLLENWLPDEIMLKIAAENNLAETAFCIDRGSHFELKWFTPELEIDLCGHATLATSHVLFDELGRVSDMIIYETKSGRLEVQKEGDLYTLNFPSRKPVPHNIPDVILEGIGKVPNEVLKSRDYVLVYKDENEIRDIVPDQKLLATINDAFAGIIVTAPGNNVDFVSRFFTPGASVFEDPVTGSAHCSLIPYWSEVLGKQEMVAQQISPRGGELVCKNMGERVHISGSATTFFSGKIYL